ncbi:hypothetical protein Vadar_017480 [Vaccinium darrowii]|uniref:Uncharacterized protein n=1 Tax=Vaccinium darrowii TaxID=229202 RepID=A0ACB7XAL9_9ERIC|nr:hypothetical protein Vadar_017480 [Vaccinium darrowii]
METIRRNLGFNSSSYVDPEGLSGGLALWWNKDVKIEVELISKNFMHVIVTDSLNQKMWAVTFVCGCPSKVGREKIWDAIRDIARFEVLPWVCMGDFNQVLSVGDKLGGHIPSQRLISAFHDLISDCGLVDLEFKGPRFTWRNSCSGDSFIMERIDMAFANSKWRELYDKAMVFVEPAIGSDHNPLILNTNVPLNKVGKPFRFESFWVTKDGCRIVVEDSWNHGQEGPLMYSLRKKLRLCKDNLKVWSKHNFGGLRLKINHAKEQLIDIQSQLEQEFKPDLVAEERRLLHLIEDLWQKDAMHWHQRSRVKWLQMGDNNSRFFHLSTIQCRQRNQIVRLKDSIGVWRSTLKEVAGVVKNYFLDLYKEPPP